MDKQRRLASCERTDGLSLPHLFCARLARPLPCPLLLLGCRVQLRLLGSLCVFAVALLLCLLLCLLLLLFQLLLLCHLLVLPLLGMASACVRRVAVAALLLLLLLLLLQVLLLRHVLLVLHLCLCMVLLSVCL